MKKSKFIQDMVLFVYTYYIFRATEYFMDVCKGLRSKDDTSTTTLEKVEGLMKHI